MKSFEQWLAEIGLESYAPIFVENKVDFEIVRSLSETDLRELGLVLGDRKRLLQAVAKLDSPATSIADQPPTANQDVGRVPPAEPSPEPISGQSPSSGERRQLTVMFCDLVGSTALSEKLDPEELRSLLHEYRTRCGAVISRYEGFIARYVGDGILTYFGWPTAHEDDAERSIRAALEVVSAMTQASSIEKLAVRIGIATGPVVVGEQAGVGDQSKLAVGSTPNLAARLQGLASGDQIVIASSTRRLIGNIFELDDLGEHPLKGIAEPVHAWQVVAVGRAASRFAARGAEHLTPLIGREQEIGLLLNRWRLARENEGQVVLLNGEPGTGKSRILSGLRENLENERAFATTFQCSPYHINSAFWSSIDHLERVLKFTRDESPESKLDKLEALLVVDYHRPVGDVRFIASILSIPYEERYGKLAMTPQKFKDETLRSLVDLTEAVARKRPSLMLFEDLHWADPTSLEMLDLLIDRVRTVPLLIVLTHRPEFQSRWSQHAHVSSLNLSKLTKTQSAAIVAKLTQGKALPGDLLEQVLNKTDGVPLYVEELTKSILESGQLTEANDRFDYAGASHSITIPATLRDSLMARLDRYAPVKEVAQIGAAIGREFSYEIMTAVAPISETLLADALAQLTDSGLAFRKGSPPEAVYTFKHALIQDAAYDSLLKSRRQTLHAKIAEAIEEHFPKLKETEPEVLAHHYTQANQLLNAIPLWHRAGGLARSRMAHAEAISHLTKGMELINTLPPSSERDIHELDMRTALGAAWTTAKGWSAHEVWNALHPALALAKSLRRNDALLPILWGLRANISTQGQVADSLPWAQEMLDAAHAYSDDNLLVAGHATLCACYFWMGRLLEAVNQSDRVIALYDETKHHHLVTLTNHDPKTQALVYSSMCTWMLGYPDRAVSLVGDSEAHARRLGHPFDLGWALGVGADVFEYRGEPEVIHQRNKEVEQLGRDNSLPVLFMFMAPAHIAIALIREGKPAEGVAQLKATMELLKSEDVRGNSPYFGALLAEGMMMLGDNSAALQLIDEQIAHVERPGWEGRSTYAEMLRLKGWMLSLKGDLAGAEKCFHASLAWAREQQAKSWELRTSISFARLWQSQGKRKEALDLLKPVYDWFTEGFDTKDLKEAKALLDGLEE